MAVICVVERDNKVMQEILSFIKSSDLDLEIHSFSSLEAFAAATHLYSISPKKQKVVAKIDVLLIDYEAFGKIEEDVKKIKKGLSNQQLQNDFPTRIILTSFEKAKFTLSSVAVDDYIFKPLEKQLFLQKLQIAIAAPEKVDPSYLALQPIKEKIEVGKRATLRYFNEFSLTIQNPGPLSEGAFVSFYSKRFGEAKVDKVLGRSLESYKDGDTYLCRFDYFGLSQARQLTIRKRYQEIKEARQALPVKAKKLDKNLRVVIIDIDRTEAENLTTYFNENIPAAEVLYFPSYTNFLATCFFTEDKASASESIEVKPAFSEEDMAIGITLNTALEITKVTWSGDDDETFLGYLKADWESRPATFMQAVDPGQAESLKDVLQAIASTGKSYNSKFVFAHNDKSRSLLELDIQKEKDGFRIKVLDKTVAETNYDYANFGLKKMNLDYIDLLFIDENYILDPVLWTEGLASKLQEMPKVIVTGKHPSPPRKFIRKELTDYLQRPLDKIFLGKKLLSSYNVGLESLKQAGLKVAELKHAPMQEDIMLATEIDMLSLSEFGIAVRFGSPIRQDMFIQFYLKSFLGMDDHEPIFARCYYSEEDREIAGKYICYFTFLGVSDEVFKRIRLWMREYYIKSKESTE